MPLNFSDTEIAFRNKSNNSLKKASWLFKSFNYPFIVQKGPALASWALKWHFPFVKSLVKYTIFSQFCGGETIEECNSAVVELDKANVKSILDYSVEGEENEENFDATRDEILRTIDAAKKNKAIAFSVFKTTGIARHALLEKVNATYLNALKENKFLKAEVLSDILTPDEYQELLRTIGRFNSICDAAAKSNVRLFVDAEDSWFQDTIDAWTEAMMLQHNKETAIIYNTIQMYRHDRVIYTRRLIALAEQNNFYVGFKIVRGAYMEKERKRALDMNYHDPIQPNKESSDKDYNEALRFCTGNERVFICAGTHNEQSSLMLTQWMEEKNIPHNSLRFYFAQLLGMSDNLSFNLAASGYNVAKYVPYGPVQAVLPYLGRRAQENSSVKGQAGRELSLIKQELKRRNNN